MRILHVTKKFPPIVGGDAVAVSSLGRAQASRGYDVHFLVYRAPGIISTARVHPVGPPQTPKGLDRMGIRRFRAMRAMRGWAQAHLASLQPDIVHAHAVDVGAAVVQVARERDIPVVLTCHGVWFPHRPRWSPAGWVERSLLRRGFDAITSVDRASVRVLREEGFPNAILVPNGVDASEFEGTRSHRDGLRFLFVGRHVYQKGIDVLLDAAARLRTEIDQPFVLEVVGEGPTRSRMQTKARELGLSQVARFRGSLSRSDLIQAYGQSSVFVLPSRFEGFPMAILEAWASGLPVIATTVGGVPEFCDDENALLIPPDDPAALMKAMASLARDPNRREALGAAGRALVQSRYSWDIIADAYDRVYASCRKQATVVTP